MEETKKTLPMWVLIVSGLFALMEIMVSLSMCFFPQSVMENIDHSSKDVSYIIKMWAARQFALGFIFAFATFKKSISMLSITYIFFLVMFIGDFFIGISQNENSLVLSALIMSAISVAMLFVLNKKK